MLYSIIDVETTGFGASGNKITDISVFVFDGKKVVDEFHSLVNPECNIDYRITQLTGITNEMVAEAPKFYEIAKKVMLLTQNTVFVAHNVNFDYGVIRNEYTSLGGHFRRKKMCTIRLSRKLIPGLPSYSLGNLCGAVGINIKGRHRAHGDAKATTELFAMLHKLDKDGSIFKDSLNPRSKEATLPPLLPREVFEKLPSSTGVYYFHNEEGKIIYVGKAKNIKQRVLSHFRDKAKKEIAMSNATANVTFKETGNELVALLHESSEIKQLYPLYNRSQKRKADTYGLFFYEDKQGVLHLGYNHLKLIAKPLATFYTKFEARRFIEELCEEFELCPKYCQLSSGVGRCFHHQIKKCNGVCCNNEAITIYNQRVTKALDSLKGFQEDLIIEGAGRNNREKSIVLIRQGIYKGYGFVGKRKKIELETEVEKLINPQNNNRDVQRILRQYFKESNSVTMA